MLLYLCCISRLPVLPQPTFALWASLCAADSSAATCAMVQGDPRLGDDAPFGAGAPSCALPLWPGTTCIVRRPFVPQKAWTVIRDASPSTPAAVVSVDLGYTATVGAITLLAGASVAPNTFARVLVKSNAQQDLHNAPVCGDAGLRLQPGQPAVVACNVTGR